MSAKVFPKNRSRDAGRNTTKRSTRRNTILGSLVVAAVVAVLLFMEQVALLYVLATLSVSALLIVVAFSSFGEARHGTEEAPFDDAAAIADRTRTPATLNSAQPQSVERR